MQLKQERQIRTKNGTLGEGIIRRVEVRTDTYLYGMQEENQKKHHDPKAEEGRDFKKEGKTGRVKAAKGPKTTILDQEWGP